MTTQVTRIQRDVLAKAGIESLVELTELTAAEAYALLDESSVDFSEIAIALTQSGLAFKPLSEVNRTVDPTDPIEALHLSQSSQNKLQRNSVRTIQELCGTDPNAIASWIGVGATTTSEIFLKLAEVGLAFGACTYEAGDFVEALTPSTPQVQPSAKVKGLLGDLLEELDVQVHLNPAVTLGDVLAGFDKTWLDAPASQYLGHNTESTNLNARIRSSLSELGDHKADIIRRRLPNDQQETLQSIADELSVTREAVRLIVDKAARKIAKDPLIRASAEKLAALTFPMTLDEFHGHGFAMSDDTAVLLLVALTMNLCERTAKLRQESWGSEEMVSVSGTTTSGSVLEDIVNQVSAAIAQSVGFGTLDELAELIRSEIGDVSDKTADQVVKALSEETIAVRDERFIYARTKAKFVNAVVQMKERVTLSELEELFDQVYPPTYPLPRSFDRRVSYLLHNNPDIVALGNGEFSHSIFGAERVTVADRMDAVFEELGTDRVTFSTLFSKLVAADPTVKPNTVQAYANAGIRFHESDGVVYRGSSPAGSTPEASSTMFRTPEGHWAWYSSRDSDSMYFSSTTVPAAFIAAAGMTVDDVLNPADGRVLLAHPSHGFGDLKVIELGASANAIYLTSKGGIRDLFEEAGVADGDRFRLVLTAPYQVKCERMDPVDTTNAVTTIFSLLGISDRDSDPSDAAIFAVGLSPENFDSDELRRLIRRRGEQFSEAYWAINPEDSDGDR